MIGRPRQCARSPDSGVTAGTSAHQGAEPTPSHLTQLPEPNNALPDTVTLSGAEFYGPADPADYDWDGDLDITAIIEAVDFWEIAARHEYQPAQWVAQLLGYTSATAEGAARKKLSAWGVKAAVHKPNPDSGRVQGYFRQQEVRDAIDARPRSPHRPAGRPCVTEPTKPPPSTSAGASIIPACAGSSSCAPEARATPACAGKLMCRGTPAHLVTGTPPLSRGLSPVSQERLHPATPG